MGEPRQRFRYDQASAISQGGRDYQEDAIVTDFSSGAEVALAVLSDGMGGHAAGDVASKIVVTEVFSELVFRRNDLVATPGETGAILRGAAESANACLNAHVHTHPETKGMGATLVCFAIIDGGLHWISIGDSPLFLFRDNVLTQLNEDHSLGPHIDMLVRSGAMSEVEGRNHPERNALTSVLLGQEIAQVDCPDAPYPLQAGDTVIVASDGLQYLTHDEITQILRERPFARSAEIADALMKRVEALEDPDLDNVTFSVVQVQNDIAAADAPGEGVAKSAAPLSRWPFRKRDPMVDPATIGHRLRDAAQRGARD